MVERADFLNGMKEICHFTGFSEATILKHKRQYPAMPVRKEGGRWIGNREKLSQFYSDLAAGQTSMWTEPQF